jgi:hypothetical protein
MVHLASQLRLDVLELGSHAVAPGLPLKLEAPLAGSTADVDKAQEHKGLRLAKAARSAIGRRMASELNQAGLVRMERQRELLKSRSHRIEEATGVVSCSKPSARSSA